MGTKAELRVRLTGDTSDLVRDVDASTAHVRKRVAQGAIATQSLVAAEAQVRGALTATAAAVADGSGLANARAAAARLASDEIILSERQIQNAMLETRRLLSAESWNRGRWNTGEIGTLSPGAQRLAAAGRSGGINTMIGGARGMASTAGLYALYRVGKDFVSMADALDEAASRISFPLEEFQRLTYAAEMSGAGVEKLEASVRFLQDRITDSTPASRKAFESLGISLQSLQALRPEEQFDVVARRVGAIADPTLRSAAAMDVFGKKTGTYLLPMIAALDELKGKAPVIAQEGVEAAAAFDDALKKIHASVRKYAGQTFQGWGMMYDAAKGALQSVYGTEDGPEQATTADQAAVKRAAEAKDAAAAIMQEQKAKREQERNEFTAAMVHRNRLSMLAGNGPDRVAQRAYILGLPGVEGMGGGDRTRGMEILEAEESAYEKAQAERKRLREAAARDAERTAEAEAAAVKRAAEDKAKSEAAAAKESAQAQQDASRKKIQASEEAARKAKEAAQEMAAAARKAYGFDLPEGFDAMRARGPRESVRVRQQRRQDAQIAAKMARLEAGERVSFTPSEKRRIGAARAAGIEGNGAIADAAAAGPAPSVLMASMESHRIGAGRGSAASAALEGSRIGLAAASRAGSVGGGVGPAAAGPGDIVAELRAASAILSNILTEVKEGGLS